MTDTMTKDVWIVRRREDDNTPYRTVLETSNFETARAEFRALCYRDLSCDPDVETRDIEGKMPNPNVDNRWSTQWEFQYPWRNGAKTRLYKAERKM